MPAEPALRIGEGSKRGDGKRVSGEARVGPPRECGARFQSPPPISRISFAAPSSLNHDPTVPTRPDQRNASRKTTYSRIVILVGTYHAPSTSSTDHGGTVPANWQWKRDILCPATA